MALVMSALSSSAIAADPAAENYRIAETQRLDQIARQLDLNYRMIWQSGFGPRYLFERPFEPWPRVPGDIWGYPLPRPITQPIGHESAQVGENRWTYRPLYAVEVPQPTIVGNPRTSQPPVAGGNPQLPAPSDAGPSSQGPREF